MGLFNLLYRPRLPNGKPAPLHWCVKLYRWTNVICWPLDDQVPYGFYLLDRFLWFLGFLVFVIHNDAELRYLRWNFNNLDEMLTGVPTYLVLIEIHLRSFSLGWRKESFKQLLKEFYANIYIEETMNPKLYKKIKRQMWPILISSPLFLCTLCSFILTTVYFLAINKRELAYKMIPLVDYESSFYIYFPLLMGNIWVGVIVVTTMCGEAITLGQIVFHLNGRYVIMRETMNKKVYTILNSDFNCNTVKKFEQVLADTLRENLRLNFFAKKTQNEFTFRMFVMFAFSAMTLCGLGFKVYTSPANSIAFIFWAIAKIQELLAFGEMGSTIITTTDQLSSMYYESKWEAIVERSSYAQDNVKLMKFVTLCILTNRQAFHFTGLKFFSVSSASALKILQGAGSYFTFLTSLR